MGTVRAAEVERIDGLFRSVLGRFFMIPARRYAVGQVTFAQMRVLRRLEAEGPCCPGRIARSLGVSASTLTELSDRLVRERYVGRRPCPQDRRQVLLRLRPRGRALLGRLARARQERLRKLLGRVSRADAACMRAALESLDQVLAGWSDDQR